MKKFMELLPGAVWDGPNKTFVIIGKFTDELADEILNAGVWFRKIGRDAEWIMIDPKGNVMVPFDAHKRPLGTITPPDLKLIRLIDEHRHLFGLIRRWRR